MKLFRKLIDHRICHISTVDLLAKTSDAVVTVVYSAEWKRSVFLFGRRIG